jgi:outer membrane protein TolC
LAGRTYYPSVTLGVDYIETGEARMPGMEESGKDPVMATVSVNIPLWTAKYRAGVRAAREREAAAESASRQRANTLAVALQQAAYGWRDAERKIALYRESLRPLAETSLKVTRQAWEAGKSDYLEVIDAQRLLLELLLEEERAAASREQRLAEMEQLIGRELPRAREETLP